MNISMKYKANKGGDEMKYLLAYLTMIIVALALVLLRFHLATTLVISLSVLLIAIPFWKTWIEEIKKTNYQKMNGGLDNGFN